VPWLFLVLSLLSASGTVHALRPVRRPWWLRLASFNAGWVACELPLHALAGHAAMVLVFASLGALDGPAGVAALVVTVCSAAGLLVLARAHHRTGAAMEEGLRQALGDGYLDHLDAGRRALLDERWPRRELVVPWLVYRTGPRVERIAGVTYAHAAGRPLRLDLYRPAEVTGPCPVVVEIHGGGWVMGDRRVEGRPLMNRLAAHGWVCISIDYRLSRRATWPDHLIDVKTALAWVREHVADHGGDPERVVVTGGSAGGHLAALAALTPDDEQYRPPAGTPATIRACVPFYGVYDFDNRLGLRTETELRVMLERPVVKRSLAEAPEWWASASPLARVGAGAPPFLVVQGGRDNLVPVAEARAFVDGLRQVSRSPVAYAELPRAHHAFDVLPSVRTAAAVRGVERFLAAVVLAGTDPAVSGTGTPPASGVIVGDGR
jgi:acetyl esterase/lipase